MQLQSGKHPDIKELTAEQRRQLIDTQQVYEAWRAADEEGRRRFAGSMRWAERNGSEYLLRKNGKTETSLGLRSSETEAAYQAFVKGRADNHERLQGLSDRLDNLAPINVAMGLGRVPTIAARIIRRCDEQGLLGEQLLVLGTNAVYAYEAAAGVQVQSGLVATGDIDLLYDARRHLSLAFDGFRASGMVGLLQKVDQSFAPVKPRAFRAANRDGYLVDLIRPEAKDVFKDRRAAALTNLPDDLEAASIFGLDWLINSPKFEAVAIDERGYPVRMAVIDPRAFALHKAWVSAREDRDPVKAMRDMMQAETTALLADRYLRKSFDSAELHALPQAWRDLAPKLVTAAEPSKAGHPNW
jgi:hypothetical protein